MSLPNPVRAVVIGAGPVGLDAALAALDAGMEVQVLEAGSEVGANVAQWGHVRLFTPWEMIVSGRMASELQREGIPTPAGGPPTGRELVDGLLRPLASGTRLAGRIRTDSRVVSVGRPGVLKHEEIGTGVRARFPFRLLVADGEGGERYEEADVVIDCSGTWANPNPLGAGGMPAMGETACPEIMRTIPDVSRDHDLAGRRVLVVGGGHSAFTAVRDLARLAEEAPGTRVLWALRTTDRAFDVDDADPLPLRRRLVQEAQELARGSSTHVEALWGTEVVSVTPSHDGVLVGLSTGHGDRRQVTVDRIVSLTGSVGDRELYRQLQVHECYATQGPMKLSAALLAAGGGADCLTQESLGAATLVNPEPGFYILGSKSYGRYNTFLLRVGYDQVSELFEVLSPEGATA